MMALNNQNRTEVLMLRLIIALMAVCCLFSTVFADVSGRYGNEFMSGGGARALGLGGAYTAQAADAWTLFWNPAGLQSVERSEACFMHSERFDGVVDYDVGVVALPIQDGSVWSAGFVRLGVNGVPFTKLKNPNQPFDAPDNRVIVDKMVNEAEYAFWAAKADRWGRWRWGIAPKLIFKHFGSDHQAYGLGIDAGVGGMLQVGLPIDVGLSVRDVLGTVLAWDTGRKEVIAPTLRIGIASAIRLPTLEATITPVADVAYHFENFGDSDAGTYHIGLEYLVREMIALRVGDDDGRLTFGGGLRFKPLSVDYAFIGHDELGETHRVSLTFRWGSADY